VSLKTRTLVEFEVTPGEKPDIFDPRNICSFESKPCAMRAHLEEY